MIKNKILKEIEHGYNILTFITMEDEIFEMYHVQDCCEDVYIEDICGDLDDLLYSPITMYECVTQEGNKGCDTETWTFYKIGTQKGMVTIRWYGTSNGYYSEEVTFQKQTKE